MLWFWLTAFIGTVEINSEMEQICDGIDCLGIFRLRNLFDAGANSVNQLHYKKRIRKRFAGSTPLTWQLSSFGVQPQPAKSVGWQKELQLAPIHRHPFVLAKKINCRASSR